MTEKIIEVWVTVLDEGTDTIRFTDAIDMGDGLYKLLAVNYDPDDEKWEFLPGSVVKIKPAKDFHGRDVLLAYELVSKPQNQHGDNE
jgi:hypothetical protein